MSTPIAARTTPGFWEGILGVADMTEAEREEYRRDMSEHCEGMRRKFADMRADVERVENLEKAGLEPSADEKAAYDKALQSVQRWREGPANGREAFAAMLDAVNLVEKKQADGLEPSADEKAAYDKAQPSVQRWREGGATFAAKVAAVKLVEEKKDKGEAVSAEEQEAHDAALSSVQRERDGAARGRETKAAKAAAEGATIRASLEAIAAGEAKAKAKAKAARESAAKAAKAAAAADAKAAAAAEAKAAKAAKAEARISAVAKALRDNRDGLALSRIAEKVAGTEAFKTCFGHGSRCIAVKQILELPRFEQTCLELGHNGQEQLAKYALTKEAREHAVDPDAPAPGNV